MSDSGKVSLPTPERMEAIRQGVNSARRGSYWADISNEELRGVLVALEESQKQEKRWKDISNANIILANDGNEETWYALQEQLVEAQQTIARHETALNEIIAYSTDKNAVDVASVSMGYGEGEKTDGM